MPDRSQGTNTETQPLFEARYSNNHTSVPTLWTATSEHQDLGVHPLGAITSSVAMNAVGSHPGAVQDATAGSGAQNPTPPGHSVQSTVQRPRPRFGVLPPGSASAYSEVLEGAVFVVVSCSSTKNGYHFRGDLAPGSKFQGVEGSKLFEAHQAAFDSVISDPANATRIESICSYGSLRGFPNSATIPSSRFNKRNGTLQTPEVSAACDLALAMRRMINESEIPQPENGYQVITAQPPFYQSLQYPRGNPLNTVGTELLSPDHRLKYDTIHEDMVRVLSLTPDEWLAAHWDYGTQSTVLKGMELSRTADQKARVQRTLEKYGAGRETGRKTGRRFSPLPPSTVATFNAASQVHPTMAQSTQEHAQHLQIPNATAWGLHCHPSNLHSLSQPFGLSQHPQYPMSGTQGWPGSPAPQTYSQGLRACYSGLQDFSANIDPYGELHLSQAWSHHGVHRYLEVPNATTPTLSLNLSNSPHYSTLAAFQQSPDYSDIASCGISNFIDEAQVDVHVPPTYHPSLQGGSSQQPATVRNIEQGHQSRRHACEASFPYSSRPPAPPLDVSSSPQSSLPGLPLQQQTYQTDFSKHLEHDLPAQQSMSVGPERKTAEFTSTEDSQIGPQIRHKADSPEQFQLHVTEEEIYCNDPMISGLVYPWEDLS